MAQDKKLNNKENKTNKQKQKTAFDCMFDVLQNKSKNYATLQNEMFQKLKDFNI